MPNQPRNPNHSTTTPMPEALTLWQPEVPFPDPETLTVPAGSSAVVVHRADRDYAFLHDCQIIQFRDTLFASWYNCPLKEMEDASVIRGRRSSDGGRTWTDVETIARAPDDAFMYVPNVFGIQDGQLWTFTLRMGTADRLMGVMDLFRFDDDSGRWTEVCSLPGLFLPNHPPIVLPDGRAVMAGRAPLAAGDKPLVPAIACSETADWRQSWDIRGLLPPGQTLPCPETTLLVEKTQWTAIIRPGDWVRGNPGRTALISVSADHGRTWSPPAPSNLPVQPSKLFAGILSTGQRYLIANSPSPGPNGRELLTICVSRPGSPLLERMWRLQAGPNAELGCGPEWSYPCAIEADGHLFAAYTSGKRHCVLSAIPVASLAVPLI